MGFSLVFFKVFFLLFLLSVLQKSQVQAKDFDVTQYGAVANERTDSTKAFEKTWVDACQSGQNARVLIPNGTYLVNSVTFDGPCKGPIEFFLQGILKAPTDPKTMDPEQWIVFRYVEGLTVTGGGVLDGQGAPSWPSKPLVISLRLEFVTNADVSQITLLNSKSVHLNIFASNNVKVDRIKISAPDESPNTDGIKIGESKNVTITESAIGSGDDCIAILSGSTNINVTGVFCGPGHGISVGSLGKYPKERDLNGLYVKNCTFRGTLNGVRIKSWESTLSTIASSFTYENIFMDNVKNPIIIDQAYCPNNDCNSEVASHVQVKDVTYKNIWGVSATKVAVNLQCSKKFPCKNVVLQDINLNYNGGGDRGATATCANVIGSASGTQQPPSCL